MGFVCRIIGRTTMDKVSRALRGHAARPQSPLPDWVPAASVVHSCRFTTPQPRAPDLLPILAREAHQSAPRHPAQVNRVPDLALVVGVA